MRFAGQTMFEPVPFFPRVLSNFVQIYPERPMFPSVSGETPDSQRLPPQPLSNPPDFATVKVPPRRHIKRAGIRAAAERYPLTPG